jgi:hypothetical protein
VKTLLRKALGVAAFCVVVCEFSPNLQAQHGLLREQYDNVTGGINGLLNNPNYPDNPSSISVIPNFEAPSNVGDFYGQRVRGYIKPPVTGNYIFWIASDDQSQLFLSQNDQPTTLPPIARVLTFTGGGEYTREPGQQSAPIRLEAGKFYYIEAIMVEGSGGDNLSVRWQLPDGTIEEPIPGSRLYVELIAPQITRQPLNVRAVEAQSATFAVQFANQGPVSVQWERNGVALAGETNLTLTIPSVRVTDNGTGYRVRASNEFGTALSDAAVLLVDRDVVPPELISAQNSGENDLVAITFSEPVGAANATNPGHYRISGGVGVLGASLDASGRTVILRTTPLTFGVNYTVTVNDVSDRADQANVIEPDSRVDFSYGFTPLANEIVYGKPESPGPSTRRGPLVISEIMYHPAPRTDTRNLEFIELYNSSETLETIGGFRLTGAVEYTFPPGTFIQAKTNLVVAAAPVDMQTLYGLTRVFGPYTNSLPDNGRIRLLNDQGAVVFDVSYDSRGEWPNSPDGAGPSLILARPSYGEADPRAWMAGQVMGGTPGRLETPSSNPYAGLVINEFLAHTDEPQLDFIELYNYSSAPINVGQLYITDDIETNKFQIPAGTTIPPLGFLSYNQNQLGFSLSSGGERIIVRNPQRTRIIDAIRFDAQANGVSMGRFPDGNPKFRSLSAPTAGTANAKPLLPSVVINEIMYNPVSGNQNEEYVELYNRSGTAIDLNGWRLEDGVSFTFTSSFTLAPGGYLVVAKDLNLLQTNYPGVFSGGNSIGNLNGNLSNGGERIALERPEAIVSTNSSNQRVTNINYIVVNEVKYRTDGRWPKWADGGGSSLELIDPNSDNTEASNWADSDESAKSSWVTLERRGIMDNGATNFPPTSQSRNLHVLMMDGGEALMDNVAVIPDGGTNIVKNPGFEGGMTDWLAGGTHDDTTVEATSDPAHPTVLHIRAAERGDTAANRIRARLSQPLTNGTIVTLKTDVKWLKGSPEFLLRLHGNYLELPGVMPLPKNLGTPGKANSAFKVNTGPVIADVSHHPIVPVANQTVTVSAQIRDPDRIAQASLNYRLDPQTNFTQVPLIYKGAGFYSAEIPGQTNGAVVAFYIEALDSKGAASRFPASAPQDEAIVLFGDSKPGGTFGTYRLWLSSKNINRWTTREQSSNKNLDATFVYNDERVVYDMGTQFSGSPFHWSGYNGPLGNSSNYEMTFPSDDLFLGQSDFVLNLPSNIASDNTGLREQVFFWMANQMNQPANYRRYSHVLLNGVDRDIVGGNLSIFEDAQQPNSDFVSEWFPNDSNGELYKIEDWFEFSDTFQRFNLDAEMAPVITTNLTTGLPEYKKERYRWWFRKRAVNGSTHNYDELFRLISAVNNTNTSQFVAETEALIDVDEWMGAIALRHAAGDWDAFGYRRGKNMYAYKPQDGKWKLMHWDIAFGFGLGDAPEHDLFDVAHFDASIDKATKRMMETPPFSRAYYRALSQIATGPFVANQVSPIIDAKYIALVSNGVPVNSPQEVKDYIERARQWIISQLANVSAGFSITTRNGADFSTNRNTVELVGTAPVNVKTIKINGVEYPVTWTSTTGWKILVTLKPGQQNALVVQGFDPDGNPIAGANTAININVTSAGDNLTGRVVINEIQYDPLLPGSEFVELHNTSRTTSYDLSGYKINGIDFVFPAGSIIAPSGFVVVARDAVGFGDAYGYTIPLAGEFNGSLDNGGETISLVGYDQTGTNEIPLSSVRYDNDLPWSQAAVNTGGSLQLIDPTKDISRVANWTAQAGVATPGATNSVKSTLTAYPFVWINEVQPVNLSGPTDNFGERDPWVELFNPTTAAISLSGLYLTDNYTNSLTKWAFPAGASIAAGQHLIVWLDGEPAETTSTQWHTSFKISPQTGSIALVGNQSGVPAVFDYLNYNLLPAGQSYGAFPEGQAVARELFFTPTPGTVNTLSTPPVRVFINEWMASNSRTIQDPDDNDFDDWFELYNAGAQAADLSGYSLSTDLASPGNYVLPVGTTIPAGGFLFIWADNENSTNGQLHASFKLAAGGESIALFAPNGNVIDSVTFGRQTADVSEGRVPNGGSTIKALAVASPGASNSGFDPNALQFTGLTQVGNSLTLSWNSTAGATYVVQYKNNITDATWSTLTTVTASGSTSSTGDTTTGTHRFYRIQQQ